MGGALFLDVTVEVGVEVVEVSVQLRQRRTVIDAHGPTVGHHGEPVRQHGFSYFNSTVNSKGKTVTVHRGS